MPTEVRPLADACNIKCTYCYQEPMRESGNKIHPYSMEKMLEQIDHANQPFSLFGGEALLVPKRDLEILWKHGYEKYKENGIQTNGTLMDDDHIEMFKKYNVGVGFSIDGPDELNMLRWAGSEDKTLEYTQKTINNILKCKKAGVKSVGVIITLHKHNATAEKLPRLLEFIRFLGDNGVKHGNVHVLEVDSTMKNKAATELTQEENIAAMKTLADFFFDNPDLKWRPFTEFEELLVGRDEKANCYWKNCDPMNTKAVYGIEGDGALTNCGRTNKEGIKWYKTEKENFGRYISLYNTPDEYGGCNGCRFWMICSGSCPGEAADNDFRNKTIHCKTQKAILGYYEDKLEEKGYTPITKSQVRPMIEKIMLDKFCAGERTTVSHALHIMRELRKRNNGKAVVVPVVKGEG